LTVEMDPRVRTSAADLARQLELSTRVYDAIDRDSAAVEEVRSLRARLKKIREKTGKREAEAIDALDAKAAALEGSPSRFRGGRGAAPEDLSRLNGRMVALLEVVQAADAAPTAAMAAAFEELRKSLESALSRWNGLKAEVRNAKLPGV